MKLLHIDSSILGEQSASRTVSREIVAHWKEAVPGLEVEHLDLVANELPHLTGHHLAQMQVAQSRDAQVLADFLAADVVVIGAPMYNFSISTQLKSWIDRVVVAGKTFKYTPTGPEGLVHGKRVIVAISRGGIYGAGAPAAAFEHLETYLKGVFAFIGVTNPEFIVAEGLNIGPEQREKAMQGAIEAATGLRAA